MNQNYQAILYDGVIMPLVDSNDSLIDTILSETLNNLFTTSKRGQIIDSSGNFWIIWNILYTIIIKILVKLYPMLQC